MRSGLCPSTILVAPFKVTRYHFVRCYGMIPEQEARNTMAMLEMWVYNAT